MKKHFQLLFMLISLPRLLLSAHNIASLPPYKQFEHFVRVTTQKIESSDSESCTNHIRESIQATDSSGPYREDVLVQTSHGLKGIIHITPTPTLNTLLLLEKTRSFLAYLKSKLDDPVFLVEHSAKKAPLQELHNCISFYVKNGSQSC